MTHLGNTSFVSFFNLSCQGGVVVVNFKKKKKIIVWKQDTDLVTNGVIR